jgi:hypothetical protein
VWPEELCQRKIPVTPSGIEQYCKVLEQYFRMSGNKILLMLYIFCAIYTHTNIYLTANTFVCHGATAPIGPGLTHFRGFTITLSHTTVGRTPLDESSARRRDLYLTTHNPQKRQASLFQRDSNPQFQQAGGRRPSPQLPPNYTTYFTHPHMQEIAPACLVISYSRNILENSLVLYFVWISEMCCAVC